MHMHVYLLLSLLIILPSCRVFYRSSYEGVNAKPVPVRASDIPSSSEFTEMLELVNQARHQGGVCGNIRFPPSGPLRYDAVLERAAQKHSADMQAGSQMSHVSPAGSIYNPPGSQLRDRINREGYSWLVIGENVAWNYPVVSELMSAWLASPHHCENILNPEFTEIGIGKAGAYWTQNFGRPG